MFRASSAFVFCLFSALFCDLAEAKFIRLVPAWAVDLEVAKKSLSVKWSIKNEGDEVAKDVALEFPGIRENRALSQSVSPGQTIETSRTFTFGELGIVTEGSFALLFRVLYKDANLYPFSAPYVIAYTVGSAPGSSVAVEFEDESISVSSSDWARFGLHNDTTDALTVDQVSAAFPNELKAAVDIALPVTIPPGESAEGIVRFSKSGALVGSSYPITLIALGKISGRQYASQGSITARVIEGRLDARIALSIAFFVLAASVLLAWGVEVLKNRRIHA